MPNSINGWPVLDNPPWGDARLATKQIPGVNRKLTMRKEVLPLFLALAKDYHDTIMPLDEGALDDWSYDYRDARFSSSWSDHASGTAVDLNAGKEGWLGLQNYEWWQQGDRAAKARALKERYRVVMWGGAKQLGGDYYLANDTDWMHWALKPGTTMQQVKDVIADLGIDENGVRSGTDTNEEKINRLKRQRERTRDKINDAKAAGESYAGLPSRIRRLTDRIKRLRKK